ncbi:MAG: hypothetical protein WC819_05655 [Parcubacteria group bacterium]|jgi:hypothetical protein
MQFPVPHNTGGDGQRWVVGGGGNVALHDKTGDDAEKSVHLHSATGVENDVLLRVLVVAENPNQ